MKFVDTMASFKYLGGTFPTHVLMIIYGYHIYVDIPKKHPLIWIDQDCTDELPKLALEDVLYMIVTHSVCVFIISFRRILSIFSHFKCCTCKAIYF